VKLTSDCQFARLLASQDDKLTEQGQEEAKTAEDRDKEHAGGTVTSKAAASRRGGRQLLKEPRKKSPSGKSRSSHQNVSLTPDVITAVADADAR